MTRVDTPPAPAAQGMFIREDWSAHSGTVSRETGFVREMINDENLGRVVRARDDVRRRRSKVPGPLRYECATNTRTKQKEMD